MTIFQYLCPLCKRRDALGKPIPASGRWVQICFGLNRKEHLGRCHYFNATTGESLSVQDSIQTRVLKLLSAGRSCTLRGISGSFLLDDAGIAVVPAKVIDAATAGLDPYLGVWARNQESMGKVVSAFPVTRGTRIVGAQFRSFDLEAEA